MKRSSEGDLQKQFKVVKWHEDYSLTASQQNKKESNISDTNQKTETDIFGFNQKIEPKESKFIDCNVYIFYQTHDDHPLMYLIPKQEITQQIIDWSEESFSTNNFVARGQRFGYVCIMCMCGVLFVDEDGKDSEHMKNEILGYYKQRFSSDCYQTLCEISSKWVKYRQPVSPVHISKGSIYLYD